MKWSIGRIWGSDSRHSLDGVGESLVGGRLGGNHMACTVIFVDFLKMFLYFLVLDLDNILHRVVHLLCICFTSEF